MKETFAIKVYKQYFNFASSHFMMFKDGSREPIHGHNYKVRFYGEARDLNDDMVFDFLNIKPIIRDVCNALDHKLIIPKENSHLKIDEHQNNWHITTSRSDFFSFPKSDVLLLPIENSSVERLAKYIASEIKKEVLKKYQFEFLNVEIEVEETEGQCAVYKVKDEL